jgi:flagellar hook-associated protein 3 FlgL
MRVTDLGSLQFQQSMMQNNTSTLQNLEQQINSGSSVSEPSDNPVVYQQQQTLQNQLTQITAQQQVVSQQTNLLGQYGGILSSFEGNIQQVRTLVQQASNGATDSSAMPGIADQINTIIESALTQANQNNSGQYLLGGTKQNAPPFVASGPSGQVTGVTYVGDNDFPGIPTGNGQNLQIKLDGKSILSPNGEDFFQTLINIRDQVQQGTLQAAPALQQLASLENNILDKNSDTGSASQYLSSLSTNLQERQTQTLNTLQQAAGVSLPSVISQYEQTQTTQQALFSVISQQSKLSLVNYLK